MIYDTSRFMVSVRGRCCVPRQVFIQAYRLGTRNDVQNQVRK